ncbi:MAG: hypothetical protein GVX96_06490 [Bacteroidetes bacterium]|jgi:hypothetical protein|nr:hypothetical protein [Bacteroidota bacterium]
MSQLTQEDQYENKIVNPEVDRLNLSGPRFGSPSLQGPRQMSFQPNEMKVALMADLT